MLLRTAPPAYKLLPRLYLRAQLHPAPPYPMRATTRTHLYFPWMILPPILNRFAEVSAPQSSDHRISPLTSRTRICLRRPQPIMVKCKCISIIVYNEISKMRYARFSVFRLSAKWPFSLSHNRIQTGGWARQQNS